MIYSLQDETNSEYKHLVNSRFEHRLPKLTRILLQFVLSNDLMTLFLCFRVLINIVRIRTEV